MGVLPIELARRVRYKTNCLSLDLFLRYKPTLCVVCGCVFFPFLLDIKFVKDVPAGVAQEEGHTGFLIHLSAVRALIFLARRIQPFLSLVDREVEFCVLTI